MIRVRIAPSPTGIPHIGNTRTALFNFLFARAKGGKFILRIEDTDRKRLVSSSLSAIYEILDWLGLKPDEKYIQSERLGIYKKHARELLAKKLAYEKEGAVWFKITAGQTHWLDAVSNKKISFKNENLQDFVILKSDGFPTYHLANVVDDYLMAISHVIRGDEWISSTPKHILLYVAFRWRQPVFAHLPVVLGRGRLKLSKRTGAESVLYYRNKGYLKEALLNYMVLLGWNPGGNREIMSMEEMIKLFRLEDINTAPPIFDIDKLNWFNGYYIRNLTDSELFERLKPFINNHYDLNLVKKTIPLVKERMKTLLDYETNADFFFKEIKVSPKVIFRGELLNFEEIKPLAEELEKLEGWESEEIERVVNAFIIKNKLDKQRVYMQIRVGITGSTATPPLFETIEVLGKEKTIRRLKKTSNL